MCTKIMCQIFGKLQNVPEHNFSKQIFKFEPKLALAYPKCAGKAQSKPKNLAKYLTLLDPGGGAHWSF